MTGFSHRLGKAFDIVRTACFRAGTRFTLTAERLHANNGPNHVAVHIAVANTQLLRNLAHGAVDTRMDAHRQAITGRIDLIENLVQIARLVANNVNNRAKHLTFKNIKRRNFKAMRRKECAVLAFGQDVTGMQQLGFLGHAFGMRDKGFARFFVNHRSDVDIKEFRVTNAQFLHRPDQHVAKFIGDVFLNEQDAQGRATLPGGLESGNDRILNNLFRQCG